MLIMREIKFRGLREKTNEWVYGFLVLREEPFLHDIIEPIGNRSSMNYAVVRGTEGQFTGLKDLNGVEIYEDDIVSCFKGELSVVVKKQYAYGLETRGIGFTPFYEVHGHCEVIGNIFEQPQLLS